MGFRRLKDRVEYATLVLLNGPDISAEIDSALIDSGLSKSRFNRRSYSHNDSLVEYSLGKSRDGLSTRIVLSHNGNKHSDLFYAYQRLETLCREVQDKDLKKIGLQIKLNK